MISCEGLLVLSIILPLLHTSLAFSPAFSQTLSGSTLAVRSYVCNHRPSRQPLNALLDHWPASPLLDPHSAASLIAHRKSSLHERWGSLACQKGGITPEVLLEEAFPGIESSVRIGQTVEGKRLPCVQNIKRGNTFSRAALVRIEVYIRCNL